MGKRGKNRACPKCGGLLYIDKDMHGWYEECLQCAYMHDLKPVYEKKYTKVDSSRN
jgi:DNA-directed RNA polymerase subunit M/transcription elongation factor TFIIS